MNINVIDFLPVLLPVALSPGASFTLAMNSALAGGRSGLFRTLAGTALGIYTHACLIALGVSAVLMASPAAFGALKGAGIAYLLWLGVQLIRSGMRTRGGEIGEGARAVTLKDAWLANVLNPKAIIFYLTVVSQFVGQDGKMSGYLALASVHVIVMSVWLMMVSKTLIFSSQKANPLTLKKWVNVVGGILLILFSLKSLF